MRSQWVPVSAAALVTGVMALVLAQTLNPSGLESSVSAQLVIAAESAGRWLAMSVLLFLGATGIILGAPAVLTLFERSRGRRMGTIGVAVLVVGSVGVGGLSALTLMFRSLAVVIASEEPDRANRLVSAAMENRGMLTTLNVWVAAFLLGVLMVAIGLFRSRSVGPWIPALLVAFLALQVATPLLGKVVDTRVLSSLALVVFASGFTGIATNAAGHQSRRPVTHTWTLEAQPEQLPRPRRVSAHS